MSYLYNIDGKVEDIGYRSPTNVGFCADVQMLKPDFYSGTLNSNSENRYQKNIRKKEKIVNDPST